MNPAERTLIAAMTRARRSLAREEDFPDRSSLLLARPFLAREPSPSQQQPSPEILSKTVVVQVSSGGKLKINQEEHTWETLGPRLETIFKERAEKVAFVKGDDSVLFMDVAHAIDIMRGAGIDKVGLITAKLEAGQ